MEHLDKIIAALDKLYNGETLVTVGIALEIVMRMLKTEKPRSIIYILSGFCHKVALLIEKLGLMVDKILPQKLKEEPKA
jgi:hypothetical protein